MRGVRGVGSTFQGHFDIGGNKSCFFKDISLLGETNPVSNSKSTNFFNTLSNL